MNKRHFLCALGLSALTLYAPLQAQTTAVDVNAVVRHYSTIVHASYEDTLNAALQLQAAVQTLIDKPSAQALTQARQAWLEAREWYGQTEAYRFYAGPIDDDKAVEGRVNAWPMDEVYVDYVKGKPNAGLINDQRTLITKANLVRFNQRGGEENIATGWHAIEFLLWGQDFNADGPGNRSFEDFVDGKTPNADRRRLYLSTITDILIDDLRYLVGAWVPGTHNYREHFERGGLESLRKIIVGMGSLSRGELAGERMEVALNTQDQEDEHSCFSDNTHRDIVNDALGIENVWLGRYRRSNATVLQGPSLKELLSIKDAALAQQTSQHVAQSVAAAQDIKAPFDREIIGDSNSPGRQRIQKTVDSLVQQSKDFANVAAALGINRLNLVNK